MNIAVKKTSDNDETMPKSDVQLAWDAPVRPYKKRDKSFFQTIAAIFFLLTVILFFIREWLIIGVALAVVFVVYVLATVPPGIVTYKITDKGVWVGDLFFRYLHLTEYWFETQLGNTMLVLIALASGGIGYFFFEDNLSLSQFSMLNVATGRKNETGREVSPGVSDKTSSVPAQQAAVKEPKTGADAQAPARGAGGLSGRAGPD